MEMAEYRWLKNYDAGVPHSLEPYPQKTLIDYVDEAAKERPDATMLIFKKRKMPYAEVQKLSDELAAALAAKGVKKGDRVALIMPNCPQAIICRLGTWKAGGILVHVNPMYTDSELEHALKDCGAETVFVLTAFYNQLKRIQPRTRCQICYCHQYQRIPSAGAQGPVYSSQREKGGPLRDASARR